MKWFALWFDTYRLDHPMETMSDSRAQEHNAEFVKQGIMNLRWKETDLLTSELVHPNLQFCMDCGGEWTDEIPCNCDDQAKASEINAKALTGDYNRPLR